ncbi:hypothetical protein HDA40_006107 [Hamadaea flava]|uniref:DUF3099 domain-containing protein n=1 Tax=Hamadaea flava TaxID=1742688 RepID=A0ABV8LU41_9ACTN|nr:hypothetical protein [Hamadaea flava]MCP2327600.1 hypothetical protein [Hamadaea flava]
MTALDRVDVDAIRTRAAQINFRRLLLTLIVGLFWLIGFAARRAFVAAAYLAAAVQVGWREAGPPDTDQREIR